MRDKRDFKRNIGIKDFLIKGREKGSMPSLPF